MANANLGEAIEVAQQLLPFRDQPGLAGEIVEMLLHRQGQERAEHVAADGGVGGMEDRPRAHDRLGPQEEVFDLEQVAVAQHGLQRGQPGVGPEHEHAVEARLLGELAGVDLEGRPAFGRGGPAQEAAVGGIADQRLAALLQLHCEAGEDRFPLGAVLLGLRLVAADDMTLRTGTSKSGAVHKYYTCSTCARKGKTACKGRSIPMSKLDALVTDHLVDKLFHPERLTAILASVAARRAERTIQIDTRITTLQTEVAEAEEKLKRLYKMVEDGVTDLDEILKDRLASIKLDRDRSRLALERIKSPNAHPASFEPEAIERFGRTMRENITSGEIPFRKAYIQSVVDRIEVDDRVIRILGSKATLEQASAGRAVGSAGVRSFERKWRARRDSNPRPPDS